MSLKKWRKNLKIIKKYKWWLASFLLIAMLFIGFFLPIPYYVSFPGGTYPISAVLEVEGDYRVSGEGEYDYVAVSIAQATPIGLISAWLNPHYDVESMEETLGDVEDMETYEKLSELDMLSSQKEAIYQAMVLAGEEATIDFQGVYVMSLHEDSTFKNILSLGDTVNGVNGKTFSNSSELIDYVGSLELGSDVTVQYETEGQAKEGQGQIITLDNGRNGIGITLTDHVEISSSKEVEFSIDGVGGPSAGLMFTLAIYDQLTEEDLLNGRHISGTGTIESDGSVGEIGGIDKKVISADEAGVSIFFVPDNPLTDEEKEAYPDALSNADEAKQTAKEIGTDMKIVPVKTAQEAIDYLRETKNQ